MAFKEPDALFIRIAQWYAGERLTNRAVGEILRKWSNKAGLPYQNPHSYRHAAAHRIIKQGGSGPDVMNILRHKSLASSTPYVKMHGDEVEERARKFLK